MPNLTWRERAHQHIAAQIAAAYACGMGNLSEVEQAVRASYPFGTRKNYPYQVWCEEVRAAFQTQATEGERLRAWNAGEPIYAGSWEWPSAEENDHAR